MLLGLVASLSMSVDFPMNVLTLVNVGEGMLGNPFFEVFVRFQVLSEKDVAAVATHGNGRLSVTKSDRYALIETTMTAMAASTWSQNTTQAVSICPLTMLPPLIRMMQMIMVKILRHRMAPKASFRRRSIRTRQRSATGIVITMVL